MRERTISWTSSGRSGLKTRASASRTSRRELCVPSIWLENTASLRTYMKTNSSVAGSV